MPTRKLSGCKTQQRVPAEALPEPYFGRMAQEQASVPNYLLATAVALTLYLAGLVTILVGAGVFFSDHAVIGLSVIVGGITTIAIALILGFARQIARQTYKGSLDT